MAGVLALLGGLGGVKVAQIESLIAYGHAAVAAGPPPEVVGTTKAMQETWENTAAASSAHRAESAGDLWGPDPACYLTDKKISGASPAGAGGSLTKRDIPQLAESIQPPAVAGGFLQRGKGRVLSYAISGISRPQGKKK